MKSKTWYKMAAFYIFLMMIAAHTGVIHSAAVAFSVAYVGFWIGRLSKTHGWNDDLVPNAREPPEQWGRPNPHRPMTVAASPGGDKPKPNR